MPKKVKTKKQKIEADLKRKSISLVIKKADMTNYSNATDKAPTLENVTNETISFIHKRPQTQAIELQSPHLAADLRKTIILTIAIMIIQVFIKFFV